mgnify:CR=1 FL=1
MRGASSSSKERYTGIMSWLRIQLVITLDFSTDQRMRGLMCIPEATDNAQTLAAQFALLSRVQDELQQDGLKLDTVSMGMSSDMAQAIAAGSTMVRVGTAIFGARHYPQ